MLMYVALGLGVLTKGPIALVIPAGACLAWLAAERRLGDLRRLMLPAGALIVALIAVPWYAAVYAQHGWQYIRFFFIEENLGRYANAFTTARGPAFFLFVLFADILLPWAPLLVIPMLRGWRRTGADDPSGAIRRLLWWWVATTVVVFSLSASKEDLYILPAIPPGAVLVADLLVSSACGASHRGVRAVVAGVAVMTAGMAALIAFYFVRGPYALAGAAILVAILAVAGLSSWCCAARPRGL
jgi:4-amino-4-deoxy-L-arabinose transferase-like glycosyltransferase